MNTFKFVLALIFVLFSSIFFLTKDTYAHPDHKDIFNQELVTALSLENNSVTPALICNPTPNQNGTIPKKVKKFRTIYVYNSIDEYDKRVSKLKTYVINADNILQQNANLYKKNLHFNFEVDQKDCTPTITKIKATFSELSLVLSEMFGDITKQKFLVFIQSEVGNFDECGVYSGDMLGDTEESGGFAIIYTRCLNERTIIHELFHGLSAVQFSAIDSDFTYHLKNATGDVMSYNLGIKCQLTSSNVDLFDDKVLIDCWQRNYLDFSGKKLSVPNIYWNAYLNHDKLIGLDDKIYLSFISN